ncbi:tetratricopeptide repeat protein [Rhizobium sp. SSA_523]|uniref:tetratricopeptide repeat protein n=1 Tax=Rhizobium sp. SSA_523 TaxID=2952477 RepID=UPI0020913C4D|nr:tetratricopeptide repeat protein [Rhizobium sp. SSA_523]MCO5732583.1 sel1 repeat family protein [Rhizobium sp. SSA_523]WKC23778.1 tetratricopeptide repeat protein [Rhizobium sp. SSA_523]
MNSRSSQQLTSFACLCAGTILTLSALTVAPQAREPAQTVAVKEMQDQCDRLAGSPFDRDRNPAYSPVAINEVDASAATACRVAFEATKNPRFAFQLGRALNNSEQADAAMQAYETAANSNYAAAKVNLGMLMGRLGDNEAEFKMYSEAAAEGNILAAYNLGVAYRDGLGTQLDVNKALKWFETAAAAGDSTAAFNIGVIYDEGKLLVEDNQMAIAWYDVAAKGGSKDAMINLGLMYEGGEGIPVNRQVAAELYAQAAAAGDTFGATKLQQLQQAGIAPAPAPEISSLLPDGFQMLVLAPNEVESPSKLKNI